MKFKLEKREILFAFIGGLIIIGWFLLIQNLIAPFLIGLPAFVATFIYHLGIYIGIFFLSSILVSSALRIKFSLSTISILIGLDIIDAPYIVNSLGLPNKTVDYWYTTYDAALQNIFSYFTSGHIIWVLTYIVVPIFLICILPILISNPKAIKKAILG